MYFNMCNCNDKYHINFGCCRPVVANPNSYYTKSEIDEKLSGITTDGISEDEASELIDEALLDYYTKDEVDAGFNTINLELDKKLDASAYTPTDLSNYYTKSQTDSLFDNYYTKEEGWAVYSTVIQDYLTEYWKGSKIIDYVSNAVSTKQDTLVSGTNIKTINGQSLLGSGNIVIQGGSSDLSNYYTRAEVDDKLDLKANASDLSALNADVEGLSISLENKADKSDIPSLADYYSKSAVDALIATLQSQIDALEAQLEECCSGGGGGEDMEGKKYLLHLTDETEHSMECNSSSTLSREDILFASGETLKASAITDVTIGDCVTEIAPMAMQFFSAMTSVNIPSSVTTIGYDAFDACSTLTSLTIPTGVTTIPSYLCSNDYNLATTNIPDGVTSIGTNAYYDCLSLLDITIPSSVTTIGQAAFRVNNWTTSDPEKYAKMQNLLANRVVRCLATTPPSVDSITFDVDSAGVSVTYPIYVPAESVEAYKAASGWSTYADRIQAIN